MPYSSSPISFVAKAIPFTIVPGSAGATSAAYGSVQTNSAVAGKAPATSTAFGSVGLNAPVSGLAAGASAAFGAVVPPNELYSPSPIAFVNGDVADPVTSYPVAGKAVATSSAFGAVSLTASTPSYGPSLIAFAAGAISDPVPTPGRTKSPISFVAGALSDPGGKASSPVSFVQGRMGFTHLPAAVLMSDGTLRRVPIRTWDGATLR